MRPRTSKTILLAGITLASLPALALDVGTATAVNPLSQSTPPGGSLIALTVGARIVHKERIQTTSNGTVQLLFLDKSSLSIGPNSNILIDNFVYNPNAGTGHMATTLAKGVIRFVGGQLSHQGEAVVNTPVSAIGIRGGTTTISHGANGTRVINHFGIITIQNGCGTVVIRRSGFAVNVLNWNTCPSEPERVTEAEIAQYLKILTSQLNGQNGGVPGLRNAMIEGLDFGALIGPNTAPILGNGESNAFQLIIQATQQGTFRTPPPPPPPPPPAPVQPTVTTPTIVTTTTTTVATTPVTTPPPTTTITTTIFSVGTGR